MLKTRHGPGELMRSDDGLTDELLNGLSHTAAYTVSFNRGHCGPEHRHRRAHLICPLVGALQVNVESEAWFVAVGQALWLRPSTYHAINVRKSAIVQFVYVYGGDLADGPTSGRINVPPLLRGILDELRTMPRLCQRAGPLDRLTSVMLDQVTHADCLSRLAECPAERRLAAIYQLITCDPSNRRSLSQLSREAGVSVRTVERLLKVHCSTTFRDWRERIILGLAFDRLAHDRRITDVAFDLGYSSASAFISAFKKHTQCTPRQWIERASAATSIRHAGSH
jgi:AraC-like DNA-binding protein/quercetin dioxygenase-like cupin family protein